MGLDTRIYCRTRDGKAPALQDVLPGVVEVDPEFTFPDGATHEVDNPWRYYDEHYERGPWPKISAVLSALLAAPNVETVWYVPDAVDEPSKERPFTADRLRQLDEHHAARVRP
jgi:hypothetical protein